MATNNLKNQIAERKAAANSLEKKAPTIRDAIRRMESQIKMALPSVITPERFTRMALSAISNNPKLQQCTEQSFLAALMNAAQLGLEPNTPLGQAYLIPYKNGRTNQMEAQFQIGYKGMIDLAHRSGQFRSIYAMEVCENDDFDYEYGLNPRLKHKPATRDRGDVIFYYAVYNTSNGGQMFTVMSVDEAKKFAARFSKSANDGPWKTNFDEMAKKTVIKKLLKYAPIRADFQRQVNEDETIKYELSNDMTTVNSEIVADDYELVDEATGEIIEEDDSTLFDN